MPTDRPEDLRPLIVEIANLEQQHANQGVSVLPKDGATVGTTRATLEHVKGVLQAAASLKQHPERVHHIT